MTNKTFPLIALALLLFGACNRIDSAFVEQLQTGLNKAQENRAAFDSGQQNSMALLEKLEQLPDGCKNDPKYSYVDLFSQVIQIEQRYASMITDQDEMIAQVEAIMGDYTDGKIKKEEAEQAASRLLSNFDGYQTRVERMNTMIADVTKTCDDIKTKWASASEAERTASAAMPPPTLPDIAASKTNTGISAPAQARAAGAAGAAGDQNNSSGVPTSTPSAAPPQSQGGALQPATPNSLVAPKQDGGKQ